MRVCYLGHSAFELNDGTFSVLIDPFITGNPTCPISQQELHPQYILVTHAHDDHLGDTVAIAKRTGATVISTFEVASLIGRAGVKIHGMALGGSYRFDFGLVRSTLAFHGSGVAGGHACGFVVHMGGKRIYHAGDTALFSDMKLLNGVIEEQGIDLALLPMGDNFTMGPREAAIATEWIAPKVVIPMHYATFPVLVKDPTEFVERVSAAGKTRPVVLKPGESYTL